MKASHERVHLTTGRGEGGRREKRRHLHTGLLDRDDLTEIAGLPVTGLERTAVDCARSGTFDQAIAVFDGALRKGADRDVMARMLIDLRGSRGVSVARRALVVANSLSESVGESWSRAQMIVCPDIPAPRLQHRFFSETGTFVARTDFDWDGRLVGEFDGLVKYGGGAMDPGQTPRDVVIAEKLREDRLRRMGIEVVRWTWGDLERGLLPDLIRRALRRVALR